MGKKILCVDDDPDVRIFVQTALEENGYICVMSPNGEDGLSRTRSERPDLVLLDVLMPRQSGIKMYRIMKTDASLKSIPVIILSGIARRTFLRSQEALAEFENDVVPEPEDYLEKPVEPEELIRAIQKVIST